MPKQKKINESDKTKVIREKKVPLAHVTVPVMRYTIIGIMMQKGIW